MKTLELNCHGNRLTLPKISFGGAVAWQEESKERVSRLMDLYLELGGNCIDTARVYGASEKMIGEWLAGKPREQIILSTKGAHPPMGNLHTSRLSREQICSDLETSLELLKTGYTDLYFLHRDDESLPVSEIMPVLHELVTAGKVHFLGASNWRAARIEEANRYAEAHDLTPFSVSQIEYSLCKKEPEMVDDDTLVFMDETEYRWYREHRFPVMAFSSQSGGFFSKYLADPDAPKLDARKKTPENLRRAEVLRRLCREKNISPAAGVLAFLSSDPVPVSAVIGAGSEAQLRDSMSGQDVLLTPEEWELLNGN